MSESQSELTRINKLEAEIATRIITESDLSLTDMRKILIVLEAVIGGVLTSIAKPGHVEDLFNVLVAGVRERMNEIKLYSVPPEGRG